MQCWDLRLTVSSLLINLLGLRTMSLLLIFMSRSKALMPRLELPETYWTLLFGNP